MPIIFNSVVSSDMQVADSLDILIGQVKLIIDKSKCQVNQLPVIMPACQRRHQMDPTLLIKIIQLATVIVRDWDCKSAVVLFEFPTHSSELRLCKY